MGCACHKKYEEKIGGLFGRYGRFVARDRKTPWIILFTCLIFNVGLIIGLIRIESESNIEKLYTPQNSQASKDRDEVENLFSNKNGHYFNQHALSDFGLYGEVIIRTVNDVNILNRTILSQISEIDHEIRTKITVSDESGKQMNFSDICAVFGNSGCVVDGSLVLDPTFQQHISNITYPMFSNIRIAGAFGNIVVSQGILQSASMVKLRYNLRDDTNELIAISKRWEEQFETIIPTIIKPDLEIAFVHSNSMNTELDSSTTGDIKYFSITFTLMITYASLASIGMNMNCIAWRPNLSLGGVLATVLAIGSALGFTSLVGIQFVSIVGVMPFLVIGKLISNKTTA